jgi:glucose-6-phosphate isomerase
MALTFNFHRFSAAGPLGATHGLDLPAVHEQYARPMATAIEALWENKAKAGAWSRWLTLGHNSALGEAVLAYAQQVKGQFDDLVILGIGGSALGGLALFKALLHPHWNLLSREQRGGFPRFHFVDNVDADVVAGLLDVLDMKRTLVNVISKSGTTAETMAAFMLLKAQLDEQALPLSKHLVFTTDAEKGLLRPLATELNVPCFEVPDDVGGRFSVFSAVGLLPAALCGLDVKAMQQGLLDIEPQLATPFLRDNPAAQGALYQYLFYQKGKPLSVLMPYSTRLAFVADWYVQLWAESLGKAKNLAGQTVNVGPTPLRAVGATDQHSQIQLYNEGPFDKVVTFIAVAEDDSKAVIPDSLPTVGELAYLAHKPFHTLLMAEHEATQASLSHNQRPNACITLPQVDAYHVAQLLFFFEVQTALAGALFEVDPFDQPGVELAKVYTHALMGSAKHAHLLPAIKA